MAAGGAAAFLVALIAGKGSVASAWLTAIPAIWAWYHAVRLLLSDSRLPRTWAVLLSLSVLGILLSGPSEAGFVVALVVAVLFLLIRAYKPYRHLTGTRRARLGLLGVAVYFLLPWGLGSVPVDGWFSGVGAWLGRYALVSLRVFWILTLVHLFLRMRLHFMRLRPKLAVLTLFVAVVPVVLVVLFLGTAYFGTLGIDRANRAHAVLADWVAHGLPVSGPEDEMGPSFTLRDTGGRRVIMGDAPAWVDTFATDLRNPSPPDTAAIRADVMERVDGLEAGDPAPERTEALSEVRRAADEAIQRALDRWWAPRDTSALFENAGQLWWVRIRGLVQGDGLRLEGQQVTDRWTDRLADMVHADVELVGVTSGNGDATADTTITVQFYSTADTMAAVHAIVGRYRPEGVPAPAPAADLPFWERSLYLGASEVDLFTHENGGFTEGRILIAARQSLMGLLRDTLGGKNTFNQVLGFALAFIGLMFLVVEGAAAFLGARITGSITSAVRALHEGTERIASGDLDTRIEVPNQDEFGDLAASFNQMAAAVKKGREEAVERERLERELETARSIQERLLPHEMPDVPGFEVAASSVPTRWVGGDYFDFVELASGLLGVAIGDVSGKGIPAALLMSNLQAALQGQVIHPSTVGEVVGRVNDLLVHSAETSMFATFFYGVLDKKTGVFTYCNAGHNPVFLLRAGGEVEFLTEGGIIIGMMGGQKYLEESVTIEPGDVLLLYTDGVTEAEGPPEGGAAVPATRSAAAPAAAAGRHGAEEVEEAEDEEELDEYPEPNMYEEDRLLETLRRCSDGNATHIRDTILNDVRTFTAGMPQSDDITLVVIKRREADS